MHASQVRRVHPDRDEQRVQADTSRRMSHGSTSPLMARPAPSSCPPPSMTS
jgi:hypothetical protein